MRTCRLCWMTLVIILAALPVWAQEQVASPQSAALRLQEWNTETLLDSLDQDRLPRKVTLGVLANANVSNFIISQSGSRPMSSYLRVGAEAGALVDFAITPHFHIQPQLILTAEQNKFSIADTTKNMARSTGLWTFGVDVPIYFLGRFGNLQQGYLSFGGGVYTHFQFATNVGRPIKFESGQIPSEIEKERQELEEQYSDLLKLHSNHFGVALMVGYELPFGMQINLSYKISLSDICTYYANNKTSQGRTSTRVLDTSIYPEKLSIGVGYRFRYKSKLNNE